VSQFRVDVRGLDAMRRALRLIDPEFAKALQKANKDVAHRIVAPVAAAEAPKRSGDLSRDVRGLASQREARVAVGRASVPYAMPIHWGWPRRNIAPNRFLERAATATRPRVHAAYESAVSAALARAGFH
jgi:hypothetical protein